MKSYNLKLKIITILVISFVFFPFAVFGAILYLDPSTGEYYPDDTFIIDVRVDTEGECINAVEANLTFSQDTLESVDFSQGDSILSLWVEDPRIDQNSGLISFAGGIPGGYCGRIPGDPGASNILGKIIFKIQETRSRQQAGVGFLDSCRVLLHDGKGTPAKLITKGANFTILTGEPEVLTDEWQEELEKDKTPPEPFVIEVRQDPTAFDGKYFLIFWTTDKQTGLDHYEVAETRPLIEPLAEERAAEWKIAESPYLLEDQELQSIIKVKAVDKAGNEMIVEVGPRYFPPEKKAFPWWIIAVILAGIGAIWYFITKLKRNKIRNRS